MSRGGYETDEESFPNAWAFWDRAYRRALTSKRGRQALRDLREALLMLPEKRLVSGAISTAALAKEVAEEPDERPSWARDCHMIPNRHKTDMLDKVEKEGIGVCAVGAYLLRKRVLELGETPQEAMVNLPACADVEGYYLDETARQGEAAGLARTLAYSLADRNDETLANCTPEERFEKYLAWIDKQLAGVAS